MGGSRKLLTVPAGMTRAPRTLPADSKPPGNPGDEFGWKMTTGEVFPSPPTARIVDILMLKANPVDTSAGKGSADLVLHGPRG